MQQGGLEVHGAHPVQSGREHGLVEQTLADLDLAGGEPVGRREVGDESEDQHEDTAHDGEPGAGGESAVALAEAEDRHQQRHRQLRQRAHRVDGQHP